MKIINQIITYGIAIAITISIFVASNRSAAKAEANQVNNAVDFAVSLPVTVQKLAATSISTTGAYPGNLKASRETSLSFRVSGPLVSLDVAPGDQVKEGQNLIQIDPRDFNDHIAVLEAQQKSIEVQLENAKLDFARAQKLFQEKVLPQADYDHATTALAGAEAALKSIFAQLQIANHQLDDTTLKAPYDCIITEQNVENYELVNAGRQVLTVQDIATLEIDIYIPENKIASYQLAKGVKGEVTLPSIANRSFEAEMSEWQTKADPAGRTYKVTFEMKKPADVQILPGMTANVAFATDTKSGQTISVPESAVLSENNNISFVWIYQPESKTAVKRNITTNGFNGRDNLIICNGLQANDLVIVQGQRHVAENLKLNATIIQ